MIVRVRSLVVSGLATCAVLSAMLEPARGQIYIASSGGNEIGKYTTSGSTINASLVAGLNYPNGVAVSGGNVFVANLGFAADGRIGKYTTAGTAIDPSMVSREGGQAFGVIGLAVNGENLYAVNFWSHGISQYTTDGKMINASLVSGLNAPTALAVSGGNIFVANFNSGTVGEYSTTGQTINVSLISGLNGPYGLAVSDGNIFVANYFGGTIGKYSTAGETINASLVSGLNQPMGLAISAGNIFVSNHASGTVGEYTTDGEVVNAALISGLNGPTFLDIEAVPEPSTLALMALGGLISMRMRSQHPEAVIPGSLAFGKRDKSRSKTDVGSGLTWLS